MFGKKLIVFVAALAAISRLAAQPSSVAEEQVLFAFDNRTLPLQQGLRLQMVGYSSPSPLSGSSNKVIHPGPPGSPDHAGAIYYGTVIKVGDELWMWYLGLGEESEARRYWQLCLAKSKDGRNWTKPELGLNEYKGSKQNNLVLVGDGRFSIKACVVYYEPEDPDPARRFKMVFEAVKYKSGFGVAYSADGEHWVESPKNPRGPWLQQGGGIKWRGVYYLNGQGGEYWSPVEKGALRTLITHLSYDFENWTQSSVMGFRRDAMPPQPIVRTGEFDGEQVHLGAGLWNRGNVILGVYGQWHGHPNGDRKWVTMDLGLVVSHDATHFFEPVPDFRFVKAKEHLPESLNIARAPGLMQGQGFANIGEETLFWYSIWPNPIGGVRLASWKRDRLGYLQPFVTAERMPHLISAPLDTQGKPVAISLNIDGLGKYSEVKVTVLDEQLRELSGFRASDCSGPGESGLRQRVIWNDHDRVTAKGPIRVRIDFGGVRPEDIKFYAAYVEPLP